MKKGIHPEYHPVNVVMTDGTEFVTQTTWGERGAKMTLVIDPKNHPAYTGERKIVDSMGRLEKFRMKYGQGKGSQPTAPADEAAAPAAEETAAE